MMCGCLRATKSVSQRTVSITNEVQTLLFLLLCKYFALHSRTLPIVVYLQNDLSLPTERAENSGRQHLGYERQLISLQSCLAPAEDHT